ncbi:MAG: dihydrolipoamide acetyltransferase family protein [Candidatus Hodarchaeales archaeon]
MVFEFKFADIGEGIHEGEILKWHVNVGDYVEEEQLLVEVHTEKVTVEITAPVAGMITSLGKEEGEVIKVGEILVTFNTEESKSKGIQVATTAVSTSRRSGTILEKDDSLFTATTPFKRVQAEKTIEKTTSKKSLAAPSVRRLAREKDINLQEIPGSGPGGRITKEDLDIFMVRGTIVTQATPKITDSEFVPGGEKRIPLRGIRRTISQVMRKSKDTAAHFAYFEEVDMSALDDMRKKAKPIADERGISLSYIPLVIKCLIPALKKFPYLNSTLDDEKEEIVVKNYYNIGISVHTDQGLIVPVIKNVDQKSVWQLNKELNDLAQRARAGKLKLDEIRDGTFTITSIGNIGGVMATPIIKWPEVAILGLMRSKLRPVVIEEDGRPEIAIRPIMYLSLSLDHRVIDGAVGAMFVKELVRYMENPTLLLLEK